MAIPHFREPASTTSLTDDETCEQLMNNINSGGGRGYEYQGSNWVPEEVDSRSGSSLSGASSNDSNRGSYPFQTSPGLPDRGDYATYDDGFGQEHIFVEGPHQTPLTAYCLPPLVHTANSEVPFNPSAFTHEFNLQPQMLVTPTAMPTAPCFSPEFHALSSHALQDNSFGLTEQSLHIRPNRAEHDHLLSSSGRTTLPLTAGYESVHASIYEIHEGAQGQGIYSSAMRSLVTPANIRHPVVASSAVLAASMARRVPGKLATYRCPHCTGTFTTSHNLQSHIRSHLGVRPYKCQECRRGFGTKHDCKRHEKRCKPLTA